MLNYIQLDVNLKKIAYNVINVFFLSAFIRSKGFLTQYYCKIFLIRNLTNNVHNTYLDARNKLPDP